MNKYSAVIFDLDGTIVDDEEVWRQAFQNIADRNGINKKIVPVPGMALNESWKKNGEIEKYQELAVETREEFMELVEDKEILDSREGFLKLVAYLKENSYLVGLATSSYWEVTDLLLGKMGLTGIFDEITTGEEVVCLKPDPEIYRLTCQKLGVEPEEVIVFEDADAGMEAATSCGCKVFKIGNSGSGFVEALKFVMDINTF